MAAPRRKSAGDKQRDKVVITGISGRLGRLVAQLMASQEFPAIRDLIEVDMMASSFFWKTPSIETVILRPVHILGSVHNAPSNFLRLKYVPTLLGFDPMIQVIHELDVVEAIV